MRAQALQRRLCGEKLVHTLKPQDLEGYQDKRREEGKAPRTIDNDLQLVHGMIKKAYDNDMIDDRALKAFRPIKRVLKKGENVRTRLVSVSEHLNLLEHSSVHMKAVIVIAYNKGMRRGEILKLKLSNIDREAGFLRLPAEITKERKKRDAPMNHHVKDALASLPRVLHEEAVFTYKGAPLASTKRAFEASCRRTGIVHGMKAAGGTAVPRSEGQLQDALSACRCGSGSAKRPRRSRSARYGCALSKDQ